MCACRTCLFLCQASVSDDSIVRVLPIEVEDKADYNVVVRVELVAQAEVWERLPVDLVVDIWCTSTGQRVGVPLHVHRVATYKTEVKPGKLCVSPHVILLTRLLRLSVNVM